MQSKQNGKKIRLKYIIDREFQFGFLRDYLILLILGIALSVGYLWWANKTRYDQGAIFHIRQDPLKVYMKGQKTVDGKVEDIYVPREYYLPDYDDKLNRFNIQLDGIIYLSVIYLSLITLFSVFKSHKMAGPIYKIKAYLRRILKGEKVEEIRLRKGDDFQELANLINELIEKGYLRDPDDKK